MPRLPDVAAVAAYPLSVTVPGNPCPKGRPRAFLRGGKITMYTPEETRQYEAHARACAITALGKRHMDLRMRYPDAPQRDHEWPTNSGYFRVTLDVYLKDKRRGDLENYSKSCCDGMNTIVYGDDSHIHELVMRRHLDKLRPRVEVSVEVIDPCWGREPSKV